jgi:dsRNA-specific ribonuclease
MSEKFSCQDDIIYNPYNERNKEISSNIIKNILNSYDVFYNINNIELFKRSFVHRSYVLCDNLNNDVHLASRPPNCLELKKHSNERLEFLGDGILENVTKFYLYKRFPEEDEGFMTEKKIALVKNDHIGKLAYKMGLHNYYILSKNAEEKKIRNNFKKLGCLFEAFIGALFLDANSIDIEDDNNLFNNYLQCGIGFQMCQIFIENIFEKLVDWNDLLENDDNYKNIFQVIIQKEFKTTPDYVVLGVDEEQKYNMGVYLCLNNINIHNINIDDAIDFKKIGSFDKVKEDNINLIFFSSASHKIKKKAEQLACMKAIQYIQQCE